MVENFSTDIKQENTLTNEYCDFNNAVSHLEPLEKLNAEEIKRKLLSSIRQCLSYLFPNGTFHGDEFRVGNIQGDRGQSLRVALSGEKAGLWYDFATEDGGDIIDLWAAVHRKNARTEFPEVMASIAEWLGHSKKYTKKQSAIKNLKQFITYSWNYLDENGQIIVKVSRHDTPDGKKYLPFDIKQSEYVAPKIRSLYNIPGILKSDKVILVEGEKCAEALINQGMTATTAMSGANAIIDKTDWTPLKGKNIVIWPDNDEPGKKYAENAAMKLTSLGIASLSILKVPQDKPEGWDVADGIIEGFNVQEFINTGKSYTPTIDDKLITDMMSLRESDKIPPKREWIIQDWLPSGYVAALYGDGGIGKSLLAQQLMTALAAGKSWLGIDLNPIKVYALFCEDDRLELTRRQYAINQFYQITGSSIEYKVRMLTRVGKDNILMNFNNKDSGKTTPFFRDLLESIKLFQPKLVILDTAADLFDGNENNRIHVRHFVQDCCGRIAREIGGAVLLCMHPSDVGIQRKTGTGGSTAWNNTVRSRWYLTKPDKAKASPDERVLSRKKSNYSQCNNEQITLCWKDGAFVHKDAVLNSEPNNKKLDLEKLRKHEVILKLIRSRAYQGNIYTAGQFAKLFEGEEGLGSERNIRERISNLASTGEIKFFKEVAECEIPSTKSKYGYLCVKGMKYKASKNKHVLVKPNYCLSPANGEFMPVENPNIWEDGKLGEEELPICQLN